MTTKTIIATAISTMLLAAPVAAQAAPQCMATSAQAGKTGPAKTKHKRPVKKQRKATPAPPKASASGRRLPP